MLCVMKCTEIGCFEAPGTFCAFWMAPNLKASSVIPAQNKLIFTDRRSDMPEWQVSDGVKKLWNSVSDQASSRCPEYGLHYNLPVQTSLAWTTSLTYLIIKSKKRNYTT